MFNEAVAMRMDRYVRHFSEGIFAINVFKDHGWSYQSRQKKTMPLWINTNNYHREDGLLKCFIQGLCVQIIWYIIRWWHIKCMSWRCICFLTSNTNISSNWSLYCCVCCPSYSLWCILLPFNFLNASGVFIW